MYFNSEIQIFFLFLYQKLDAFLKQKYNEMQSESDNLLLSFILQDTPKRVREATEKGWFFNFFKYKKAVHLKKGFS